MPLIQERARTLAEVAELTQFFFVEELDYAPNLLIGKNMSQSSAFKALETARERLEPLEAFDAESLEAVLRPLAEELELKTGQLFGALRIAVTGRTAAPPLFQTMAVLGKERCLRRIKEALDELGRLPK
jgi:glutamyl-tRNA synthetase